MLRLPLLFLLGLVIVSPARAADPTATPYVVDGDTLVLEGRTLDLLGIDAPEKDQDCGFKKWRYACGRMATYALVEILGDHWVRCKPSKHIRRAATCYIGADDSPKDVAAMMVRRGWAVANRKVSTRYVKDEKIARAAKSGLWQGAFDKPWDWRKK